MQRQTQICSLNFPNLGEGGGVIFVDRALWSLALLSLIGAPGRN